MCPSRIAKIGAYYGVLRREGAFFGDVVSLVDLSFWTKKELFVFVFSVSEGRLCAPLESPKSVFLRVFCVSREVIFDAEHAFSLFFAVIFGAGCFRSFVVRFSRFSVVHHFRPRP